jgi:hypothetical protein
MRIGTFIFGAVGMLVAASALRGDSGPEKVTIATTDPEQVLLDRLNRDRRVDGPGYELRAQGVSGTRLFQPVFKRLNGHPGFEVVVVAKQAEVKVDARKARLVIRMRDGIVSGGCL